MYDRWRGTAEERGYGADWKRLRNKFIAANPLCIACEAEGLITVATEVHHKVAIKDDPSLRLEWSNLRSICHPCHMREEAAVRRKTRR